MLKKHMAACLFATAVAAAPAFAQNPPPPPSGATDRPAAAGSGSTTTGSSAMQPSAGSTVSPPPAGSSGAGAPGLSSSGAAPSQPGTTMAQTGEAGNFMTGLQPSQVMASKLMGTTVVSANNESIGDVNDIVLDRNGQVAAVVIGVGGFLGIGEKDVAVPFRALEFASREQVNARTSSNAAGQNVTATGSTAPQSMAANAPAGSNRATATTGNTGAASSQPTGGVAADGAPDRIVLRMTKAELEAAPTFRTSQPETTSAPATGTTPPKQ